ncbi:hypothetical protein [Nostoc sp.]|uniref:hypothetical protein n=1 Tax=Nostoc sp. TaxID=1180 RepID=UPI002FFC836A
MIISQFTASPISRFSPSLPPIYHFFTVPILDLKSLSQIGVNPKDARGLALSEAMPLAQPLVEKALRSAIGNPKSKIFSTQ